MPPIVSFFHCTPKLIRANPGLGIILRRHGIRHLELAMGHNPAYGHPANFSEWLPLWEAGTGAELDWSVANGWRVVVRCDDWMQFPFQQAQVMWENGRPIRHMAERLHNAGNADWCELCDEMKPEPEYYPIDEFADLWNGSGGPPLACPGFAPHRFESMDTAVGGISRQWKHLTANTREEREARFDASLSGLPNDARHVTCLIPTVLSYFKKSPGGDFNPQADHLVNRGVSVNGFERLLRRAVRAVGLERLNVRIYALDTFWKPQRASTKVGSRTLMQTGTGLEDDKFFEFLPAIQNILVLPSW